MSDLSLETIRQALDVAGGNFTHAARQLQAEGFSISRDTIRRRLAKSHQINQREEFEVSNPHIPNIDVEALIADRAIKFQQRLKAYNNDKIINIRIKQPGPIGIGWFGDPHVDDDGTDIDKLFRHARLFDGRTKGLYGACIGDLWNNWQGRLARLWAEQSTSAEEARAIVQEFLQSVYWLLVIKGNHDCWSGSNDVLDFMLAETSAVAKPHRAIIHLHFPNGRVVEIYASHDFKGRSQWSTSFGPAKKAQMDRRCRIYVCGHLHDSAYQHGFHPDGRMWHALRMASYKKIDEYVEQLDLEASPGYECPVSIIDPDASEEINLIRWEWDPEEAAKRLTWMRKRV